MVTKTTKRAKKQPTSPKTYDGPILVLKTTKAGGEPHCNGSEGVDGKKIDTAFRWPRSGVVTCEDWDPTSRCGHGFHGLEFGEGDWSLLKDGETPSSEWRVVRVQPADLVRLADNGQTKVKFRTGEIVYSGDKAGAMVYVMCGQEAMARAAILADEKSFGRFSRSASSGNLSRSASSGNLSRSASSGDSSSSASSGRFSRSASSGNFSSSASSGDSSRSASSGNLSRSASSGDLSSSASSGRLSHSASSGDFSSSASSGRLSHSASSGRFSRSASSGDFSSSASSGDSSSSEQTGASGIAAALGDKVRGKAGENGLLILTWWDAPGKRYRACVGEVGIDGIEVDTWYEVKDGKLSKVTA